MDDEYRVYVLQNNEWRRYIGLSRDLDIRLRQHNDGKSKWTAKYRPWRLFWQSAAMNLSEARKLENLLKHQKGGIGLQPLLETQGEFIDSSS